MEEKILKEGVETFTEMTKRINSGYSELKQGESHLLFCHAGVVQNALIQLGITDLMVDNCGISSFHVNSEGKPIELIGYWDPPRFQDD